MSKNKSAANSKKWIESKINREISVMQNTKTDTIEVLGVFKRGRPTKKSNIVKTNLDLTAELINELDKIVDFLGTTRQSVIKQFILEGLNNYYVAQQAKINIEHAIDKRAKK